MKRRMKQKKYGILMVVAIVVMVLMPFAPCRADWNYINSEYSTGPTYGFAYDAYSWCSFSITNIDRSANSSGASTSSTCEAVSNVDIMAINESISRSPSATAGTWCLSRYYDPEAEQTLYVDWEVDGDGTVYCTGFVGDLYLVTGSLSASSTSIAGMKNHEDGDGFGYAWGRATTTDEDGEVVVDVSGTAEEDFLDFSVDLGYYGVLLTFIVEGEEDNVPLDGLTQYTAKARTWAYSSCSGSANVTEGLGQVYCFSNAYLSGSSSLYVSW